MEAPGVGLSCRQCPLPCQPEPRAGSRGRGRPTVPGELSPPTAPPRAVGRSALAPQRSRSQPLPSFPNLFPPLPGDTLLSGPSHAVTRASPASRPPQGAQRGPSLPLTAPLGRPPGRPASVPGTPAAPPRRSSRAGALGPQPAWPRPPRVAPRRPPGLVPRPRAPSAVGTRLRRRPGRGLRARGGARGGPARLARRPGPAVSSVPSEPPPPPPPPAGLRRVAGECTAGHRRPGEAVRPATRQAPTGGRRVPGGPAGRGSAGRGQGASLVSGRSLRPPRAGGSSRAPHALREHRCPPLRRCQWAGRAPRQGVGVAAAVTSSR